jgi:hypothetical protein
MSRITDYAKLIQQRSFLEKVAFAEKVAQMGGFSQGMADLAQPLLFGMGGYGLSKALGGEQATGIPDYLLGPAAGIGIGMPLMSGLRQGVGGLFERRRQQQQMQQQQAEIEQAMAQDQALQQQMQEQSQNMLQQLAMQQAGMPEGMPPGMGGMEGMGGMPPGMTVTGSLRKAATQHAPMDMPSGSFDSGITLTPSEKGGRIGAGTGALLGSALSIMASKGKNLTKAERLLAVLSGTGGGLYVGKSTGELLGPGVSKLKQKKEAAIKPRPQTSLKIPAEQAEQIAQQAGQRLQQQMQTQQKQQMQQAATAQLIKGQYRGLQDRQRRAMKQA